MSLGREIHKARYDKDLKQKDLAVILGLSPQYVSNIELDYADPPFSVMQKLAGVLALSLDALPAVKRPSKGVGYARGKATARKPGTGKGE